VGCRARRRCVAPFSQDLNNCGCRVK
jgi:hypothetical protein